MVSSSSVLAGTGQSGNEIRKIGVSSSSDIRASSVKFSSDGRHIISGWEDGDIAVWDLQTGRIEELEATVRINIGGETSETEQSKPPIIGTWGNKGGVLSVAISPDGTTAVSGNVEGRLRIWNLQDESFTEVSIPDCPTASFPDRSCRINDVSISFDGRFIATAHEDGSVRTWSTQGKLLGEPLSSDDTGNTQIHTVFVDNNRTIITGDSNGYIRVWQNDIQTDEWRAHRGAVNKIILDQDLNTIISAGDDGSIRVRTANKEFNLPAHQSSVTSLALSADNKTLISSDANGVIRFWDFSDIFIRDSLIGRHESLVSSVAFHPESKMIASGGWDEKIRLWDFDAAKSGREIAKVYEHEGDVSSVDFNPTGDLLAAASDESSSVWLWNINQNKPLQNKGWAEDIVTSVAFSPIFEILAIAGNASGFVWKYNYPQDEEFETYAPIEHNASSRRLDAFGRREVFDTPSEIQAVTFSPDGETIISGDSDGLLYQWGGSGYVVGEPFQAHEESITSVAFHPDCEVFATTSEDWTIKLWKRQYDDPNIKRIWRSSNVELTTFFFKSISDEPIIIDPPQDNDPNNSVYTGDSVSESFQGHEGIVWDVAFHPSGNMLATGGEDGTIRLWDLYGRPIGQPLTGHRAAVRSLTFSPDGQFIVSGSADRTVRLWRGGEFKDWLGTACNRLSSHPVFQDPDNFSNISDVRVDEAKTARDVCNKFVFLDSAQTNSQPINLVARLWTGMTLLSSRFF